MTPERWHAITAAFHGALARDGSSRHAFLDHACRGDSAFRAEVEALLAAHQQAGRFGDQPVHVSSIGVPGDLQAETITESRGAMPTRTRTLFAAIVWLGAAVTAAAFSYALWILIVRGGTVVDTGWQETRHGSEAFVASIAPGGPAAGRLQEGDRILRLNGVPPVPGNGTRYHRRSLSPGDHVELEILRSGAPLTIGLDTHAIAGSLPVRVVWFVVSLIWCSVALFIGLMRPDSPIARLGFAAALSTGFVFLQVGVIEGGPLWQPLHVVLGYHFFSVFPTGRPATGFWRGLLYLIYPLGAASAVAGMTLHAAYLLDGAGAAARLGAAYPQLFTRALGGGLIAYSIAVVSILAVIRHNYRSLTDEDQRRRVQWVMFASIIALAPALWWAVVASFESTLGLGLPARFELVVDAASAAIPITVAYVVLKHRVFDISVVVRRSLQYLLAKRALQAAVAVPLAAVTYTVIINRHRTLAEIASGSRAYLYWIAAAGASLYFRRPIRTWLDRKFFRLEHDREQVLLGLLDDLDGVGTISDLSRLVHEKLEFALHPKTVIIWYRDPNDSAIASSSNPDLTPPDFPTGRWLMWLEEHAAAAAFPLPAEAGLTAREERWLVRRGASLAVPIGDSTDRLIGVLLLGEKKSEEPYGANDQRLLHAIARQVAVVRENLRLRAQVSEDHRIKHDVLARLDARGAGLLKECPACGACFDGAAERCEHDDRALVLSLPVTRTVDAKYRLDRLIGKGGMGAVYEAADLRLGRTVAIKIMVGRNFGDGHSIRRFRREARAIAQLNHPNIVGVHDFGLLPGDVAYLVLEKANGSTLRDELRQRRTLPPGDAAEWFRQLLDGLGAAHSRGVVHRDLKPENVVGATDRDGRLTVKILDFGLAKLTGAESDAGTVTTEGRVMGTLGYMSPEQHLGAGVDHRSDLFTVGVMAVEALAGERPFSGRDYAELSRAVMHDACHLPRVIAESPALDACLRRCLAKRPEERFASAAELGDALVPLLRASPDTR